MRNSISVLFSFLTFAATSLAAPTDGEVAELLQGLRSPDAQVRVRTADTVQKMDEVPEALMPALFDLVMLKKNGGIPTREELAGSVAVHFSCLAIAKYGKRAVPQLREYMNRPDTRWSAVGILKKIGPDAEDAIPELIAALSDRNRNVRALAVDTLKQFGPKSAPAVDALIILLRDKDEDIRESAIDTLGEIGPPAAKALPNLKRLLKPEYTSVSYDAAAAIAKIETPQ